MKATAIVVFLLINRIRLGLIKSIVQSTTTKEPEIKVPVAVKVLGGGGDERWRESETMTSSSLRSRHSQSASRLFETRPCLL